ncbi:MAG: ATP-binding protein, partial [Ktedonobacteraceae bacterium]
TRAYEQEGTIPYRPWTDILRALLQDLPLAEIMNMLEEKTDPGETAGALHHVATAQAKLARLSSLLPELATHQELSLPPNRPATPEQERLYLWEAVLSLLNALSQFTPLLLVLDDLHWTDDSSLELLAYLARHQPNERIMWIGTCQEMELAPSASLRALLNDLRREQMLVTLPLQPLSSTEIARLLAHVPRTILQSIQSQSGGNPLFAEELARFSEAMPLESSQNESYYPGHELRTGLKGPSLPETIAAVLERRLNTLNGDCQALLSKAAVLGGSFELRMLLRMMGEAGPGEDTALDLLEAALRSGLLTEEASGGRIVYHFWHPLIVSHLYERLSAARRAQLHRRAASALIELHTDSEAEVAAAITHHLSKYGQEKQQLACYAEMAGNQARAISAYPEALYYYRQALEALHTLRNTTSPQKQNPLRLANLLECLAECNDVQGNYQEALQQYIQVLELHNAYQIDVGAFDTPQEWLAWQQEEAQVQA